MVLNVDTDGFRRTGELVDLAAGLLGGDFDTASPTPPCASDPASQSIMRNLDTRRDWLVNTVRSGAAQASTAAGAMNDTATDYDTEDHQNAGLYDQFGGGSGGGGAPVGAASQPSSPAGAPPPSMPSFESVPDVSGTEGEALALQLEAGAGPGPAVAAASRMTSLAARATAAYASLSAAQAALAGTGESLATPGMATKITRGMAFTQAVAGHATALAGHYQAAGDLHTLTYGQVGPSVGWQVVKTGLMEARVENSLNGGLSQPKVDAFQQALQDKEQVKGEAATGLQTGGTVVSTPPGDIPNPAMDPKGQGEPGDDKRKGKKDAASDGEDDPASPGGDMLQSMMGALGPLTQSLGKANPMESLGQLGQLGQQFGKLGGDAAKKAAAPLNPATLANKPMPATGKGAPSGKGGGSPIKPSSTLPSATHAASLTGAPQTTPATTSPPVRPAAASAAGTGGMAGGMMPMGHKPGGGDKASKIDSYEQPLPDVDGAGRPGVVGEAPKSAAPVVNPEAQNAVKARMARRKRDESGADQ